MADSPRRNRFRRRSRIPRASPERFAALTQAFLACDDRLSSLDESVAAVRRTRSGSQVPAEWAGLRERLDAAVGRYLQLIDDDSPMGTPDAVEAQIREFGAAIASIDDFAARHRRELDAGAAAEWQAQHEITSARTAAAAAVAELDAAPPRIAELASVRAAATDLSQTLGHLDGALGLAAQAGAAGAVAESTGRLTEQLRRAPGLYDDAQRSLRSLTTRADSVEHRLSTVPATMSSLLREFSAECSDDLHGTEARVRDAVAAARMSLERARRIADAEPDVALELATAAREQLAGADAALSRVANRLAELRDVKRDPAKQLSAVRFRLRDAQLLALSRGLAGEWGSVLDALAERLDRAHAALDRIHPDYWRYLSELRSVEDRITGIVARMRAQLAEH